MSEDEERQYIRASIEAVEERLIAGDVARQFMAAVLNPERIKALLSDEHFSIEPAPAKAGAH